MDKALDKETIKTYLLGRISDEETLAGIEEALFFDDDFAAQVELTEDEIIDDYVFGNLTAEDRDAAENFFFKNSERQFKLKLTQELENKAPIAAAEKPHFFEALKVFFRQPAYVGAFAVLLVVVIGLAVFLSRSPESRELADLRAIYQKDRSVQTRISEFGYAPLNITRGENEDQENRNKLRRIENSLLEAVEKNPTAENRHALGVFYLTQRKFDGAINELEIAAKLDDKNAKIANDLGSAFFEMARNAPDEKKSETLAKALGNFRRATELDPNLLEALFNKALCLQELGPSHEAKEAWNSYLEKDPNSGWAQEARKNLESLENLNKTSKTKEQVLEDFLNAYRGGDKDLAWKINCQTKDMLEEVWLPGQLTRRYLEAERDKRQPEARESIEALNFIGEREKTRNADFFVTDLTEFYSKLNDAQIQDLLKAKDSMKNGLTAVLANNDEAAVKFFEESAKLFSENGNIHEQKIAEYWAAQCKVRPGKLSESLADLNPLASYFEPKKYKWLYGQAIYWISQSYFHQNEFTKTIDLCRRTLKISEEIADTYGEQKSIGCLLSTFEKLGETTQSLKYLGQMPDVKNLYYYGGIQARRDNVFAAKLFYRRELFAAAESFGKEGLILAKDAPDKTDLVNSSLEILAKIYAREKRFEEALNFANESKQRAQANPESRLKTFILAKATLQIAEAKRQMQRCDEAVTDYDAAIGFYAKMPEIRLNDFVIHKGKLLCYQALRRENDLQAELETVLNLSERYRSQILKDEERQTFFDGEQFVYDVAVENSLSKNDPVKAFETAEGSKARSLLDFVAGKNSIADLEKQFPDVSKPLSPSEIQTRMPGSVQIVQFAVLPEKTVAWTLTKTEIKTAEIKISADDLQKKISDYLASITGKADKSEVEKSGKELYELLIAPVVPNLDPSKEICFVPDKSLYRLPFAALVSERGRFLLEDFRIFYSPSASVFVFASERAKALEEFKDEHLLSIGNPAFDKEKNASLAALPAAEDEARAIAKFYPQPKLALGAEATKTKFLAEIPNAQVIHFAGHYVANSDAPGYSRLLFSADGEESDLRSFEIAGMKLPRAKLVVLSACQTGIEKYYEGEGAIGIARTFLAVGAPLVAASSWSVNSDATKDLMIAFHRNRRENGLPVAEALRQAQIEMLKGANENFRQPYFWAAFSIIGGSSNY
jgi:CHAT domain-containing protein/cytochrome c-type biogenesis protein CcmH/NrfG/TPR repeat protein